MYESGHYKLYLSNSTDTNTELIGAVDLMMALENRSCLLVMFFFLFFSSIFLKGISYTLPEVRAFSGQKLSTNIIYIVFQTSLRLL